MISITLSILSLALIQSPTTTGGPLGGEAQRGRDGGPVEFLEIPGVQELTSRLIVRPVQRLKLMDAGVNLEQVFLRRRDARHELRRFELIRYVPETDEYIIHVPAGRSEMEVADELLRTGNFEYVEPDWRVYPMSAAPVSAPQSSQVRLSGAGHAAAGPKPDCPDDFLFPIQWHHASNRMASCEAWMLTTGDPSIGIGICDTGLRTTHEELQLNRLEGYNAVDQLWESEGGSLWPAHYHGTRTTGTIAATGDNGVGCAGIGWNLSHRMLRVSNASDGGAFLTDIQHGARTSIESGDRIANASYHGVYFASNLTTATYIESLGGILVWIAGNTSSNYSHADRDDDVMIVVGATSQSDTLATFSSYGTFVDLVAPGVSITTSDSNFDNDYASPEGTSYAGPLAAGVLGLIWSERPNLSPADVERILKESSEDLGAAGIDPLYGYGRVNAFEALMTSGAAIPSADFAALPISGQSPLSVDFRDLSSGVPTAWAWDFGDGGTSTQQNPSHVYTSSGAYTVTLDVSNEFGADQSVKIDLVLVDIIPPVAEFSANPVGGLSPMIVQFTDESTGGLPTSWLWDFGDGNTSTEANPSHTYTTSGFFTVSLTVGNAFGSDNLVKTDYIAVDFIPPVAGFSGQPTTGNSPFVVDFTDESTMGAATSWSWVFGDGYTSSLQHPAHTYTVAGTYSVRLTVTNPYGSDQLLKTGYITVGAGPPLLAEFIGTPLTGPAPLQVDFTDLSLGHVTEWQWNFGDETKSSLQNPTHVYTTPGKYNVALEVGNADGANDGIEKPRYIIVQ